MGALARISRLTGRWMGSYRLIVNPSEPIRVSESTARVMPDPGGQSTRIDYTWEYEEAPQNGTLSIGSDKSRDRLTVAWTDTWHMRDQPLSSEGPASDDVLEVRGSSPAPSGPDWGWRTRIEVLDADSFRMAMYNVTPDGQEYLAVDAVYHRAR